MQQLDQLRKNCQTVHMHTAVTINTAVLQSNFITEKYEREGHLCF